MLFGADLNLESPCLKKTCEFGAVCVVKNSEPVCECSDACSQDQDPVCGSDGHTYSNSCQMKAMGCALQKQIQMQHKGPCGESTHTLLPLTPSLPFILVHPLHLSTPLIFQERTVIFLLRNLFFFETMHLS